MEISSELLSQTQLRTRRMYQQTLQRWAGDYMICRGVLCATLGPRHRRQEAAIRRQWTAARRLGQTLTIVGD